ncbi:hypothetical protein ACFO3J_14200 [Streptomyces polygonati]|uniref:Uncharacterized protein n=1 Tax=Streptomyces polygonati TaxID=1617087 RepID=A0ABV8HM07_9ACTN
MPETPAPESLIETAVLNVAGRATLPFQAARADRSFGTAFWYNDLVESGAEREVIRQYLVTADRRTRYDIGQFTLREGLAEPELPADELVLPGFVKKWTALGDLGVAAMPTTDLHIHAERKAWRWTTDEITSGLAARPEDIALLGPEPLPGYLLGHEVVHHPESKTPERPQTLLHGAVTRPAPDAPVRWSGPLPVGFDGAPVFAALPMPDEQVKLVCLGLVLPAGDGSDAEEGADPAAGDRGIVVTFDLLRPAIHSLTPPRTRRWWQRG